MTTKEPTPEEISAILAALEALDEHQRFNKMLYFVPAAKHKQFFELGTKKRERMFAAGNGVGKSESGSYEDACHLTGDYPDDWAGIKYEHPVKMWVACETSTLARDVMQSKLCGQYGVVKAFGTGFIPRDRFADKPTLARGVTDAFDTIQVVHKTKGYEDGVSTCAFKSFEQGREKFQGENLDFGHCDEEPPMEVYSEFLARIRASEESRLIVTFTPLHGKTDLYNRFAEPHPDRAMVTMSLDEATWYTEEQKRQMIEGYPKHERDARRYGIPLMGSGRIFPYADDLISEPMLEYLPPHWVKIWGIDFGIGHPFAAVLIAWDRDNDIIHVLNCYKQADMQPIHHAAAMRAIAADVPVAWPQDGTRRVQGDTNVGDPLSRIYKNFGLKMVGTHATWPEGGYSTEAGIMEMDQRMTTGKLKVASHLSQFFEEYRSYHRKDGLIVKVNDDLLSGLRIAIMMKRYARAVAIGGAPFYVKPPNVAGQNKIARNVDFDFF